MSFVIEKEWEYQGFPCVAVFTDLGTRCGYVGVKKNHLLYGLGYDQHHKVIMPIWNEILETETVGSRGIIPLVFGNVNKPSLSLFFNVHGSITFSGEHEERLKKPGYWWFGFDTGHAGDKRDLGALMQYFPNNHSHMSNFPSYGEIRTLEYVIAECEGLVDQLIQVQERGFEFVLAQFFKKPVVTRDIVKWCAAHTEKYPDCWWQIGDYTDFKTSLLERIIPRIELKEAETFVKILLKLSRLQRKKLRARVEKSVGFYSQLNATNRVAFHFTHEPTFGTVPPQGTPSFKAVFKSDESGTVKIDFVNCDYADEELRVAASDKVEKEGE